MGKESHGFRVGTRKKMRKEFRSKFKVSSHLKVFKEGDRVTVKQDPSSHRGMPHPRFRGLTGKVVGLRGSAVVVKLESGNKTKTVISMPEHLIKQGG